jgi:hypothetical protein
MTDQRRTEQKLQILRRQCLRVLELADLVLMSSSTVDHTDAQRRLPNALRRLDITLGRVQEHLDERREG